MPSMRWVRPVLPLIERILIRIPSMTRGMPSRDDAVRSEHDGVMVVVNEDQARLSAAWFVP